jgi:hypothetical protein
VAGTYAFVAHLFGTSSSTAGVQFGVQYSGTSTSVDANQFGQTSTTGIAATAVITALNASSTTVMTTANAQAMVIISGSIVVTGAGNLTIRFLKVTSGTATINASSNLVAYKTA